MALIGSMMMNADAIDDITPIVVTSDAFGNTAHRTIYTTLCTLEPAAT